MAIATTRHRGPLMALFAAGALSQLGNAITTIAMPLIVLQTTGSAWATGLAGTAATAPLLLGGVLGGVVVDRLGFRRASIIADIASGLTIAAVPVLLAVDALPFWLLLVLVFFSNLLDAPGRAARASQLPELTVLAGLSLEKSTAIDATVSRMSMMLGAAAAGGLVALVGAGPTLLATAVLFAGAVIVTVLFVPVIALEPVDAAQEDTGLGWRGITAGIRFVWTTPLARAIVGLLIITNLLDIAAFSVLNPIAASTYSPDGAAYGAMTAVFAGGALIGAALSPLIPARWPRRMIIVVLFTIVGPGIFWLMALRPPLPILLVGMAAAGLLAGPLNPILNTALLRVIPATIRARALGALSTGVAAGMPVGTLLAGAGVDLLGLTTAYVVGGVAYLVTIIVLGSGRRWRSIDAVR
ncbi:MFS transporter [Microbacterium sp. ZW T5_56]|uniref:MFS transporter n=1 Tax=Microbacterium sp. ZW T5_56 TaxID=3378081 RepID=UPI0038552926